MSAGRLSLVRVCAYWVREGRVGKERTINDGRVDRTGGCEVTTASSGSSPDVERLNRDIAERVKQLEAQDLVDVLTGRAASLLRADDNQNQNQNQN